LRWHYQTRERVFLACRDYGGVGEPVMLLHGLAGYAGEWSETASWLTDSHRVICPEQRGHGRSWRYPSDMSRTAFVDDVAMWVSHLGCAPAILVGHSLGGHTAFLVASRHPDLVRGLVVVEAEPEVKPDVVPRVQAWLEKWPRPFASREDALRFFGGNTLRGRTWVSGLREYSGGLWATFEIPALLAALHEIARYSYWEEWARIRCPTLIVYSTRCTAVASQARMLNLVPHAQLIEIPNAGHDLHLDQPELWRESLEAFLSTLGPP
jgi:pimeloyl-ACP methyl ester carboxylesterase